MIALQHLFVAALKTNPAAQGWISTNGYTLQMQRENVIEQTWQHLFAFNYDCEWCRVRHLVEHMCILFSRVF